MKKILFILNFILPLISFSQNEYVLDKSFDPGSGFSQTASLEDIQILNSGKALIGGDFDTYNGTSITDLIRINTDGTLDNTFTKAVEISSSVRALGVQSTDKILVSYGGQIGRLNADGTISEAIFTNPAFTTYNILVLSGDGFYLAGSGVDGDIGISRHSSDGTLDGTFNTGTGFLKNTLKLSFSIHDLALQADNKILVAGDFISYNGTSKKYLVRLNTDGSIDNTFDYTFNLGNKGYVKEVEVQSYGKIVISAQYNEGTDFKHIIQRLTSTGSLDNINIDQGSGTGPDGGLAIDSNNDIWVSTAGGTITNKRLLRVSGTDGAEISINPGINNDGLPLVFGGGATQINDLVINSNDDVFIIGDLDNFNGFELFNIAKLTSCSSISVSQQPENSQFCIGETATFMVQASGAGTITYQWQLKANDQGLTGIFTDLIDGGSISGTTSNTLSISNISASEGNKLYRCVIKDDNCIATSNGALLTTLTAPQITVQPTPNVNACEGTQKIIASVTSTGGAANDVKWQVSINNGAFTDITDATIYSGFNSNSLSLISPQLTQSGNKYRWVMYSCQADLISDVVTLGVNGPPVIETEPSNVTLCVSGNASFSVLATGATYTYQWQYSQGSSIYADLADGGVYSGVTTATLNLTGVDASLPEYSHLGVGQFRCKITINECVGYSSYAFLYIISTPVVTTQPLDASYCLTDGVTQTHTFTPIVEGQSGMLYQWQVDTGTGTFTDLTDNTTYLNTNKQNLTINQVHSSLSGYKYRLKLGNCNPLTYTNPVTLTATNKFEILPITTQSICEGSDVEFTGQVIIGGIVPTYQWTVYNTANGIYENLSDNTVYSGTQTATLKITGATMSLDQQRFQLLVTGGACTIKSNAPIVRVYSTPSFQSNLANKTTCEGTDVVISSNAGSINTALFSYQWQVDNGTGTFSDINNTILYSGYNSTILTLIAPTADMNGYKYRNVVKGCVEDVHSSEAILTVEQKPIFTTQPVEATVCIGEAASFDVEVSGSVLRYLWEYSTDGVNYNTPSATGITTNTITITTASVDNHGYYRCAVTSSTFCGAIMTYSDPVILTIQQTTISVQPSSSYIELCETAGTDISITALGENLTYQWLANDVVLTDDNTYSGVNTNNLTISNAIKAISGTVYKCVVNGDCQEVSSNQVSLVVYETPKPVIVGNFDNPSTPTLSVQNPLLVYNWYLNDILTQSNSASIVVAEEGIYKVQGTLSGNSVSCESEFSDDYSVIITDIESLLNRQLNIYPNPVAKSLMLKGFIDDNSTFNLFSSTGKLVRSGAAKILTEGLDVSNLNSGQYILKLSEKTKSRAFTIIKN